MTTERAEQKHAEQKLESIDLAAVEADRLQAEPAKALAAYEAVMVAMDEAIDCVLDYDGKKWLTQNRAIVVYNMACMNGLLGKKEEAHKLFRRALVFGFDEWDVIATDRDADLVCIDRTAFDDMVVRAKRLGGPLTIQRVIDSSILQETLTEEGIDPRIGEVHRALTIFHHEWVQSPELKGLSCLMLAGSDDKGGCYTIHDLGGKTLFFMDKIDGAKLEFIE